MSVEAAVTIVVTIALAAIGYAAKYVNDLRLAQRKDRLDRINRQLSDLYGPLFALVATNTRLWVEFRARYRSHTFSYWDRDDPPTADEAQAWREWMSLLFIPNNRKMMEAVLGNADLIRESGAMPVPLVELCAHAAGYEITLARWQSGDFDPFDAAQNTSVFNYPYPKLQEYVSDVYSSLKDEQGQLLRTLGQRSLKKD